MSEAFVGEIRMFTGTYAPKGWYLCNGALITISENQALYSLIGTIYGGDGRANFALPDLRGRLPIGLGQGVGLSSYTLGQKAGTEFVTLLPDSMGVHTHTLWASNNNATSITPGPALLPSATPTTPTKYVAYVPAAASGNVKLTFNSSTVQSAGGNQAHLNVMPTVAINFIIAGTGIYPTQAN